MFPSEESLFFKISVGSTEGVMQLIKWKDYPYMPSRLFYLNSMSISNRRSVRLVFMLLTFIKIPVSIANSVEPDQTPRSASSDLELHCLPMSLL